MPLYSSVTNVSSFTRRNGTFGAGGGGGAFVGALDDIDNLFSVCGLKRLRTDYVGALVRLRRASDNVEADFAAVDDGWVSISEVTAWLGGSTAFVRTVYDQSGLLRHLGQSTTSLQPQLILSGAYPYWDYAGADYLSWPLSGGGSVAGFAKNDGSASIITVRKYASTAATATTVFVGKTGSLAKINVFVDSTGPLFRAGGRRLDADSSQNSTGLTGNTTWGVEISAYDWSAAKLYHDVDASSETTDPFQTAGLTSNTDNVSANSGANATGTQIPNAQLTAVILVEDLLSVAERSALITSLAALKVA